MAKLTEIGIRPVTLLDGHVVRKNLYGELGFSEVDRGLDIKSALASGLARSLGIGTSPSVHLLQPWGNKERIRHRKMIRGDISQVSSKREKLATQKFTIDVLVRLTTQTILQLRNLIFLPLIAKTMGAMQYGAWAQITVTLTLLVPAMMLRLDSASVRYLSSKRGKTIGEDFFPMLFLIWSLLIVTFGVGLFFRGQIAGFLFGDRTQILYTELLLLLLAVRTTFTFLRNYYRTFNQIRKFSVVELISTFASIGVAVFFVLSGKGLAGVLLSFILVEAFAIFLVLVDILRLTGLPHSIKMANLSLYLRYSLPLIPDALLLWVINSSDRYLIAHMLDLKQVGIYSASYSLGLLATFFLTPISFVLFPVISKFWEERNPSEVKRYLQNSLRYYLLPSVPVVFGIYYLAPFVLKELATQEFVTDRLLILFIVLGFFCVGLYQIYLYIIHLQEKTWYLPLALLTVAALNLGLNFILIPKIGIMGAAFSTFLAYLALMVIIMAISAKLFWIGFDLRFFAKTAVASAGMFLFLRLFKLHSFVAIVEVAIMGAVSYLIFMVFMKGIGQKEWELLKAVLKEKRDLTSR